MNYKNEALRVMQEIANEHPDYTLGDVLYSCFQKVAVKNKQSLNFLREVEDEDLYTLVEKAQTVENE
jgi:succinate dehydrogenase flavin-adding protein (antitoxin of CptAB toxin-antitoxin module)